LFYALDSLADRKRLVTRIGAVAHIYNLRYDSAKANENHSQEGAQMFVKCVLVALGALFVVQSTSEATSRKSPWVYHSRTLMEGEVEYEQWVTFKTNKKNDAKYNEYRFRHELEWGVTDRFQLAVYVADWRIKQTSSGEKITFHDVAVEGVYQIQAPSIDQLGMALYGEVKFGSEFLELEGKWILEWEFEQVSVLYNLTLEAEWEGSNLDEKKGKVENALSITYQPSPSTTLGVQAVWEKEFPEMNAQIIGEDVVSIGPSVSWQNSDWWFTFSPLFQVTNIDSEPDLQVRLLFGFDF
jgi:hypothetical protein